MPFYFLSALPLVRTYEGSINVCSIRVDREASKDVSALVCIGQKALVNVNLEQTNEY